MPAWKKFTGSEEQIIEMKTSKEGFKICTKAGTESNIWKAYDVFSEQRVDALLKGNEIDVYMICQPHPHAEMIIEWARTGRDVYWYNGCGQWVIDDNPVWWADMKYSFNPDGQSVHL
ncbi:MULTISPECIES: hypothetical protein [Nitrosomonas]|uniref:Uncharacterized protein n=1 Tax=Nitrosomonas communis TaxID=44574 RepID=A0A0F7KHP0_9PROT|nr:MULTISPECIES: hypothetical protein [Nitrosomonas]AKH38334.1 hypothetical protein AAW31_11875 [Nitrosomonas communis]TYP90068.1 hypothetical protein BCL69_10155 [Nitrosomonas communis]UVS60333.1 hypothetical protein NX761_12540 [Nitrosomonas sp. PLL12]